MRLFLTGFMGAGKTEVGKVLANRLGVPLIDLDQWIEVAGNAPIPEIVERHGEGELRRLESAALRETERFPAAVIATGGGAVVRAENRAWMRRMGRVVWLNPPFELLLHRLDDGARRRRPLFRSEDVARNLLASRIPFYRDCDHEVSVRGEDSVDAVADRVLEWYAGAK